MDLHTFVRILGTRWLIVATAVAICLLGAVAATVIPPSRYQASSKIFISVADASTVTDKYNATQAAALRLSSYAEIAGGSEVAGRAIDQLGIDMSPDELVSATAVEYVPESLVFELTVTDTDRDRVVTLVNAMSDQFSALVGRLESPADGGQPPAAMQATVVERPTPPQGRSSPNAQRNLALGLIVGLLLGTLLALVRDATDRTLRTGAEFDEASDLPMVGELRRPRPAGRETPVVFGSDGGSSEAYRGLRARLLHLTATTDNPMILVTGPVGGEGATTVAVNLALALAETDDKVLLVEGDLRKNELASLFGVNAQPGLSDVLRDPSVVEQAVAQTDYENLSVMTSGSDHAAPGELLGSAPLASVIDKLRSTFDFVVVDGPAVLSAADALLLATRIDGTLLVGRRGTSRSDEVSRAVNTLHGAGAPIIGTVFTNARVG
ncbi:succinoglycan biosynthesis transport protein ExoP [Rhodococcus sp. PvR044]|uniref:polysaccharide biosynthesis tyrosine autokinase n=1 Tax=unclassified Rhodococcus (in: high G+C Gram-positive bacteria) TaxID=192944 RepID=UPI000BC5259E|nr:MULTISPECIES: polysaccharide biosynthesis tyrosine autokinase [unclassified Rhodococcus (in: high G+C Gram-positive bacteria)]PTR42824.1 capsular exopolysaccharide synthesis family protein [Rhodococcus sp. OK611]SNX91819.1 capsular exopolysaccharide family [Rhodococcus sp. OK270]